MTKVNDLVKWILSQTLTFNKRDFKNSSSLEWHFENLLLYRQSTKLDKYETFLQMLEMPSAYDQHLLIESWKLLLKSERLYEEALKFEARTFHAPEKQQHLGKNSNKVIKPPKQFKLKLQFFRTLKDNLLSKKQVHFEDKVEFISRNFEINLMKYFKTFVTHCKRYGLVSSEDQQNLQMLFNGNKKFHNNLWILHKKIQVVCKTLQAELTTLEFQVEESRKTNKTTESIEDSFSHILDEWGVYQLIVTQLSTSLQNICNELEKYFHMKGGNHFFKSSSKNSIEQHLGTSMNSLYDDALDKYIHHEACVSKLLVDNISNFIVQLRIESPAPNRFDSIIVELKDCLNLFRSRQRPRPRLKVNDENDENEGENDYISFESYEDINGIRENSENCNDNDEVLEYWRRKNYSLEVLKEEAETMLGRFGLLCNGKRRSSL